MKYFMQVATCGRPFILICQWDSFREAMRQLPVNKAVQESNAI